MTDHVSLRLEARDTSPGSDSPEVRARMQNLARLAIGAGLIRPHPQLTPAENEATIRALESSARRGEIYDLPTLMLGLRQQPRYESGRDNARALADTISRISNNTPDDTRSTPLCDSSTRCSQTPITLNELGSVFTPSIAATPQMNARREITITPGMAAIMGAISTFNNPGVAYSPGEQRPGDVLANDQREFQRQHPGGDVIQNVRLAFRGCIQPNSQADLATCVGVGSQFATYMMATDPNGFRFAEHDPLFLVPLPDVPNMQARNSRRDNPFSAIGTN